MFHVILGKFKTSNTTNPVSSLPCPAHSNLLWVVVGCISQLIYLPGCEITERDHASTTHHHGGLRTAMMWQ
jgi:hypothetical protein